MVPGGIRLGRVGHGRLGSARRHRGRRLARRAATPDYQYDYGDNITYQDGEVYYGSQPMGTQQQYYQGAANLAGSSPGANSGQQPQWLPLGVFGLIGQGQQTPEMVFQLALDKAGAIRGNYYDQVADTTAPVTGAVERKKPKGRLARGGQ